MKEEFRKNLKSFYEFYCIGHIRDILEDYVLNEYVKLNKKEEGQDLSYSIFFPKENIKEFYSN